MSEFEFWDELGNIFNAIVAYQQKTIEFNKRFVNPWIRLGTVFDQNDHNADSLNANKRAIEIDQDSPTNWLALGDVHFKMGALDDAADAYRKAIELNPRLGWAHANLALICATRQKFTEAINLYVKSLELITDDKDRSMIWNRLGNTYRKVNDYENAFIAFQMADECDGQNTGFEDVLDEVTVEQRVMPIIAEVYVNNSSRNGFDDIQPVAAEASVPAAVEDSANETSPAQAEEPASEIVTEEVSVEIADTATVESQEVAEPEAASEQGVEAQAENVDAPVVEVIVAEEEEPAAMEPETLVAESVIDQLNQEADTAPVAEVVEVSSTDEAVVEQPTNEDAPLGDQAVEAEAKTPVVETVVAEAEAEPELQTEAVADVTQPEPVAEAVAEDTIADDAPVMEEASAQPEVANFDALSDTTTTPVISHDVETFADPSALNAPIVLVVEDISELIVQVSNAEEGSAEITAQETETESEIQFEAVDAAELDEKVEAQSESVVVAESEVVVESLASVEESNPTPVAVEESESIAVETTEAVNIEMTAESIVEASKEPAYDTFLKESAEPVLVAVKANAVADSPKNDLKVEPDTKNAHVWNELGNVYFNTGSYEEAVSAYSKAIELDDWFAWPYSNLALVYVQKEKYAEAILLYQRSIELFASDKDKAITWNRLGNVYRRLNDYDNAIVCYQRADELDPNNATRSLRSRFSLLGSLNIEQSSSLAV